MASPTDQHLNLDAVRAVVFDYGGVLIDGGPRDVRAFGRRVGLEDDVWEALRRRIFGNDGTWAALERGEVSLAEFQAMLRREVVTAGGSVDERGAGSFLGDPDPMARKKRLRPKMLDAVRSVRTCMKTALLTNNVAEWRRGWSTLMPIGELFDVVIDSSAVGCRKPEPAIYEITRRKLELQPENLLFLDDIGQNLKTARSLGWQTVLVREEGPVLELLQTLVDRQQAR